MDGKTSPLYELKATLKATLKAFNKNSTHKIGIKNKCIFKARTLVLNVRWPGIIKKENCSDFEEWKGGIDAGELYLVYSSAYPNNSASMFGHTFLRFDRNQKNNNKVAEEMLGYSFAFQVRTDSSDNAFLYTLKGVTGGYFTHLEMKPYYMNLGIYNNSESRDLWEYPISLSNYEKELLLAHMWEVSNTVTFPYYFFDENCSTFMLLLLEAIKIDWNIKAKEMLFIIPQVVVRDIKELNKYKKKLIQRHSIRTKITKQINNLSEQQQNIFSDVDNDLEKLKLIDDPLVLDVLIDFWKYKNYQAKTKLSKQENDFMSELYSKRSKINIMSKDTVISTSINHSPHLGHAPHKLKILREGGKSSLSLLYGFHDFMDPQQGFDSSSYINFFDVKASKKMNSFMSNSSR
jgi:hypothetical protein